MDKATFQKLLQRTVSHFCFSNNDIIRIVSKLADKKMHFFHRKCSHLEAAAASISSQVYKHKSTGSETFTSKSNTV